MIDLITATLTVREKILIGLLAVITIVWLMNKIFRTKRKKYDLPTLKETTINIHRHLREAYLENKKLQDFFGDVEGMRL